MFLVSYTVLQFLLLTGHAWHTTRNNKGPPCYGRSDCVVPFADTTAIPTEKPPEDKIPKRYIILEDFKSPIFGAYKFDPVLGEFVMSSSPSTAGTDAAQEATGVYPSVVMRAAETTTTKPLFEVRRINEIDWIGNDSDATIQPLK